MKIAHIVPYSIQFPLKSPTGRYNWVIQLATMQAKSGHDVTLYCHPESKVEGVRILGIDQASDDKRHNNIETFRLAFKGDHDIYHSHFDDLHYEVAHESSRPIIYTQHWWPTDAVKQLAQTNSGNVWAVPPTKHMYEYDLRSNIHSKGFIYHGIDLELFSDTVAQKNDRLLFVGRISPEKNLDVVLAVSLKSGIGLDIIGKITEKNATLWNTLQPLIDGEHIRYLGTKTQKELISYYTSARAVLFPADINEAFGLVAIEAQACGTPIIMKRGGSRNELVEDNKTGFLCETEDEFISAAAHADLIHPEDCITFAQKFDVRIMEKKYEQLYQELLVR